MRTADRVIAHGVKAPADAVAGPLDPIHDELRRELRRNLPLTPIIVADNVEAYHRGHGEFAAEDLPSLAPPWPDFWIEYPSHSGRERRGVLVSDCTDELTSRRGAKSSPVVAGCLENVRENGYPLEAIRWLVQWLLFVEGAKTVLGPYASLLYALDSAGKPIGNRWITFTEGYNSEGHAWTPGDTALLAQLAVALQTVGFLHCRNVKLDDHDPEPRLSRSHRRRHGQPLMRWQTVRLEVPRRQGGGSAGNGQSPSLHIQPGNFAHYGDCCPGAHPPNGKLFGRLEGVYWRPAHLQGDPRRGVVKTDYELETA